MVYVTLWCDILILSIFIWWLASAQQQNILALIDMLSIELLILLYFGDFLKVCDLFVIIFQRWKLFQDRCMYMRMCHNKGLNAWVICVPTYLLENPNIDLEKGCQVLKYQIRHYDIISPQSCLKNISFLT